MHAIELPRELAAVPISVLRAYLSDVLLQVLQAVYPGADITPTRVLREMDSLLSASFAQLNSFVGAAAPGHDLPLSANLQQATNTCLELQYQHECLRFTCSSRGAYCSLCERTTERRCETDNNFAPKQIEGRPLMASCGAPIRVCLRGGSSQFERGLYSSSPASTDRICFEFSILSGALHDSWLQQAPDGVTVMDKLSREACEVLKSKKGPKKALLVGGWMSVHTKELRVRLKPCSQGTASVELSVLDNSEAKLGKDMQYKLLVRAINEDTNQELAQTVSQGFAVTTSRSKSNFKPEIVCLEDPLSKLEGLGTKTITRLQDVQLCIQEHNTEDELPDVPKNRIETVREFKALSELLRGHIPKALAKALLPEAAVEHARGAVELDTRMRRWRPHPESPFELLYRSSQAQVRWSTPAALVDYRARQVFLEGHMGKQQQAQMMALAGEAFQCWKQDGHPGWSLDDRDSSMLDDMHQREMEKRSCEGMGNCNPTPSGQQQAISGHTGASEQSITDMQGAQGSVQGLDRRALLRAALCDNSPARQPLMGRYNAQPSMVSEQLVLDRQGSGLEGPYGMSWQQLRQSLSHPTGLQSNAKPSHAPHLGLEQETPCRVLPGRLFRPELGSGTRPPPGSSPQDSDDIAEAASQEGVAEAAEEAVGAVARNAAQMSQKMAQAASDQAGTDVRSVGASKASAAQDGIPLSKQLQMPLSPDFDTHMQEGCQNSPVSGSAEHQGLQNSPSGSSSPSADSCPSSPDLGSVPAKATPEVSPDMSNSTQVLHLHDNKPQAGRHSLTASPTLSNCHAVTPKRALTPGASSLQQRSTSGMQSSDPPGYQKQNPEAQALSQALSLMPEHETDMLGLDDIPSSTSSGLLQGHAGNSTALVGGSRGLPETSTGHMGAHMCNHMGAHMGAHMNILGNAVERMGVSTDQLAQLAAQLGRHGQHLGSPTPTSPGHARTANTAGMAAEMLGLLAGTHRQSVVGHSDPSAWPWVPHSSSDGQHGTRALHISSDNQTMLMGSAASRALQQDLLGQVCSQAPCSLPQHFWHHMSDQTPIQHQAMHESLSRAQSASAAYSTAFHPAGTAGAAMLERQPTASPTSLHSLPALKRKRTSYDMDIRQLPGSWGMHSPGQHRVQQPPSHGPAQGSFRQLLFPEQATHASHAKLPAELDAALLTQGSSSTAISAPRSWRSVAIPPAVTADSGAAALHAV